MAATDHRSTRSKTRQTCGQGRSDTRVTLTLDLVAESPDKAGSTITKVPSTIKELPARLTTKNTGLSAANVKLLLAKQSKLQAPTSQVRICYNEVTGVCGIKPAQALLAAFVFGQEEAGTAVCISSGGVLLTCSHCVAEEHADALGKEMYLVSAEGRVVSAQCTAWDGRRDLALLQITAAEKSINIHDAMSHALIAASPPKTGTKLRCIGHPGSEDLEATTPGQATGYDVLHISEGRYRGLEQGQDVHDNSEIGALKHDCWTYWGHSGAPLTDVRSGELMGLHSSWDESTGMRRGIGLECITAFLLEHGLASLSMDEKRIAGTTARSAQQPGSRETPIELD